MGRTKKPVEVHEEVKPHTVKKFELIEKYVEEWAYKILGCKNSKGVIFIDCMSNSGSYKDEQGNIVEGTAVRVTNKLNDVMARFPAKAAKLFFNDISQEKIDVLKDSIETKVGNIYIKYNVGDANQFLENFNTQEYPYYSVLLLYDPYDASIDWKALTPFFNNWGEVIINHMVSDTSRGVGQAQKAEVIRKYTETYQKEIEELIDIATDKEKLEKTIEEIIISKTNKQNKDIHIASFPFYNRVNGQVYNLVHFTKHIEGFVLFKKVSWQTFGDKSSLKNTHGNEKQLSFYFDDGIEITTQTDEHCYYVKDIAKYIYKKYSSKGYISLKELYSDLEQHPVFPSDGYKTRIKDELKANYNVNVSKKGITFR